MGYGNDQGNWGNAPFNPSGPGAPPPGQMPPPGMYYPPPQQQGSGVWKFILIGCLGIVIIGSIVLGGSCYYLYKQGGPLVRKVLEAAQTETVNQLSDDHTDDQKLRFQVALENLIDQLDNESFVEWAQKYQPALNQLQAIQMDQVITVEESQAWAEMVEDAISRHGVTGEPTYDEGAFEEEE